MRLNIIASLANPECRIPQICLFILFCPKLVVMGLWGALLILSKTLFASHQRKEIMLGSDFSKQRNTRSNFCGEPEKGYTIKLVFHRRIWLGKLFWTVFSVFRVLYAILQHFTKYPAATHILTNCSLGLKNWQFCRSYIGMQVYVCACVRVHCEYEMQQKSEPPNNVELSLTY